MSEITRIADQLARAFDGPAWHGPSLEEILVGVTASMATAKPIPNAHSIWELLLHIAAWDDAVARRIRSETIDEPPEGNFPPVPSNPTDATWAAAQKMSFDRHRALVAQVKAMTEDDFFRIVKSDPPGRAWFSIHGDVGHILYHAGQIMLLKKALTHL